MPVNKKYFFFTVMKVREDIWAKRWKNDKNFQKYKRKYLKYLF